MLKLKHQIIDAGEKSLDTKAILGLDLTKAFDTVTHKAILQNLQKLDVGRKTYAYIKDFLTDRTAKISIGESKSDALKLGNRVPRRVQSYLPFYSTWQ